MQADPQFSCSLMFFAPADGCRDLLTPMLSARYAVRDGGGMTGIRKWQTRGIWRQIWRGSERVWLIWTQSGMYFIES